MVSLHGGGRLAQWGANIKQGIGKAINFFRGARQMGQKFVQDNPAVKNALTNAWGQVKKEHPNFAKGAEAVGGAAAHGLDKGDWKGAGKRLHESYKGGAFDSVKKKLKQGADAFHDPTAARKAASREAVDGRLGQHYAKEARIKAAGGGDWFHNF